MLRNKILSILMIVFLATTATAHVQVAFFEARDPQGNLMTMENGGRYYHVAISVGEKWLHTHVYWGVQLVSDVLQIGEPALILESDALPDLQEQDIKKFLKQKYDTTYSWSAVDKTYCSKLVAQILKLPPSPMAFSGTMWRGMQKHHSDELGISPDDLYYALKDRGFKPVGNRCQQVFRK